MALTLTYDLIPDGITTIVQVKIEGEFYVETAAAAKTAEAAIVRLVSRITETPEEMIRGELEGQHWMGEGWRPDEPTAPDRRD